MVVGCHHVRTSSPDSTGGQVSQPCELCNVDKTILLGDRVSYKEHESNKTRKVLTMVCRKVFHSYATRVEPLV